MIIILRVCIAVAFSMLASFAQADARVFNLNTPNPQQVVDALHARYGDALQVELVQQKLVIVGSEQQLNEVSALLTRIDPTPAPLRLQLREQPPNDERANIITYSSDHSGYTLDTVEGAFVVIDYSTFSQQVTGAGSDFRGRGWWVDIKDSPTEVHSLTLQIHLQNSRSAVVMVNYTKEENQERRVYGNTVSGNLGSWIALLPQPAPVEAGTIRSGPKPGSQLYLRIDKQLAKTQRR